MIDRTHPLSIARQAKVVGISRGSVSIWPQGASQPQVFKLRKGAKIKLVRCH